MDINSTWWLFIRSSYWFLSLYYIQIQYHYWGKAFRWVHIFRSFHCRDILEFICWWFIKSSDCFQTFYRANWKMATVLCCHSDRISLCKTVHLLSNWEMRKCLNLQRTFQNLRRTFKINKIKLWKIIALLKHCMVSVSKRCMKRTVCFTWTCH